MRLQKSERKTLSVDGVVWTTRVGVFQCSGTQTLLCMGHATSDC